MRQGLLWYDGSMTRTLAQKVARAARRYEEKFSAAPDVCYVHPSALVDGGEVTVDGVAVKALRSVLRDHFWVGWEEDER